tara:strand:+ start:1942 stop:2133 length:192 start_codon:yes stop_codon:yes gene_type:complete
MSDIEKAMKEAHAFADRELKKARSSVSELRTKVVEYALDTVEISRIHAVGVAVVLMILGAWFG